MRKPKTAKDKSSTEEEDEPHITIKQVIDRYKEDGIDLTVEQAQKIRVFLHKMAKIALNQILREK
jgi:hypothetical protein